MKKIIYIFCNRAGHVETFKFNAQQHETDAKNLELFEPDKLRGTAQAKFGTLVRQRYSLSNWHVIEEP